MDKEAMRIALVDAFPASKRRKMLWENFEALLAKIQDVGLRCKIWIDGSYVTKKVDPDDIDLIVEVDVSNLQAVTSDQRALLGEISNNMYHGSPMKLHTFFIFDAPVGHALYAEALAVRDRWVKDWGYSLRARTPKGILVLEVVP